jgi:Ribbon-helix-helix protein, copG family
MIRTVISLERRDKEWLDRKAKQEHVSMATLIRKAVRRYREERERDSPSMDQLLQETKGSWRLGDGLAYQRRVRGEWKKNR